MSQLNMVTGLAGLADDLLSVVNSTVSQIQMAVGPPPYLGSKQVYCLLAFSQVA